MMSLNDNEKDFQKKLQEETEIPVIVHERVNQAYRLIENNTAVQKKAPKEPYHWMKLGGRIAGGMAAVLAVGFVLCAVNPVMAKNLPVVGGLFEMLQDNVSFFGDFSEHATTLEDDEAVLPKGSPWMHKDRFCTLPSLSRMHGLPGQILFLSKLCRQLQWQNGSPLLPHSSYRLPGFFLPEENRKLHRKYDDVLTVHSIYNPPDIFRFGH